MPKPYVIVSPDFNLTSGGIRVMWGLYGWLLARGQEVYMNRQPHTNVIAIYPEIVQGNPVGTQHVVRYILNKPGVMMSAAGPGPTEFPKTDILYYFSRLFGKTDDRHYMFLPILDLHIFKDQHKLRNKKAVFFGKGQNLNLHPQGCIEINHQITQDQKGLADLLNECEVLYCYDPVTAMTELARLCGCRIVIFPSIYSKDEFKQYEPGMNGISWGKDESVPLNTEGFREHYGLLKATFNHRLETFIKETQCEP